MAPKQHLAAVSKPCLGSANAETAIYLRTLLIHGGRSVLRVAERKAEFPASWLARVMKWRNHKVAAVVANMPTHDSEFNANYAVLAHA